METDSPQELRRELSVYYLLLVQSSAGNLNDIMLPATEDLEPESFIKAILAAYLGTSLIPVRLSACAAGGFF